MSVAGIHFGNTNSVITINKDGKIETASNETGDRITSTILAYTGTEKVIGQPAKHFLIRNPQSCITNIKAAVGGSFTDEDVEKLKVGSSCDVINVKGNIVFKVKVEDDVVKVKSSDVASYIFTKLLEIGEHIGGSDLEDVVLTVPVNFSEEQRIFLSEAAESVGYNVLRIITEPAAALLAYGIGQEDTSVGCTALVFRLGGTSMDATIMKVNSGMFQYVSQKVNDEFGAKKFDDALVKYLIDEFKRKMRADISDNKRAISKLKSAVEECKHGLTSMTANNFAVDSLYDGMDFSTNIIRAKFESICNPLFNQITKLIDELLQSQSLTETQIDKVVFVGGGTRMPRIVSMFKNKFSSSEILNHINAEEVLAHGAAIQASLLQGRDDIDPDSTLCSLDCTSKHLGIKVVENDIERLEVIISKNTPVPTRRSKTFKGLENQTSVCLSICEADNKSDDDIVCLAQIVLTDLPEGQEKDFSLNFEIKRTGSLIVNLSEKHSKKTESVTLQLGTS